MQLIFFGFAGVGFISLLSLAVAYNSDYMLSLISSLCRVHLAYRTAGRAARAKAWKELEQEPA
jgi:hypothetical protein